MTGLTIGLDASPLALTRAGTARYVTNLLAALEEEDGIVVRPYAMRGTSRLAKVARDTVWYFGVLPLRSGRDGVDVLHCPTIRAPARSPVPLVVTIHDVAVLRHPEAFNPWTRAYSRLALPLVARAASHVIAVSEFTRRELAELVGDADEKVRVVPLGVGPPFTADGPAAGGEYVFTVSTVEPRKNLSRLARAFEISDLRDCELWIAGAQGWGNVSVDGHRVRLLGQPDDDELARLYRGARCVAYVSLYEGFGLPVLEAMACGAPVVTTGWGATAEAAGGAAVLVDALDEKAIAAGLVEAATRREELARLGPARAASFTWRRTAQETAAVYREAAERGAPSSASTPTR